MTSPEMITRIEARGYRSLRDVSQELGPFQLLVGANASGKSSFLDVVSFVGDVVENGLESAIDSRTPNFHDLVWGRSENHFELAVEFALPSELRSKINGQNSGLSSYRRVVYECAVCLDSDSGEIRLSSETVALRMSPSPGHADGASYERTIVEKVGEVASYHPEPADESGDPWTFWLGPIRSALGNLPEDEERFAVALWVKKSLSIGIRRISLNNEHLRSASPPGRGLRFRSGGSNLPWILADFENKHPERFEDWIRHLQMALPDLVSIRTMFRPEDRHGYLLLRYQNGLEVPSWMASDGTLRLLALTLPAYVPGVEDTFLIEEPENGIHPRAIETMMQSLSSIYDAQVLLSSHSPIVLSLAERAQLLCFSRTEDHGTSIVGGDEHPMLRDWQGEINLSVLFAAGVLG